MTNEEFKEITRAVVLALREELGIDNKAIIEKFSEVENKLKYNGEDLSVSISPYSGNNLVQRTDGLYVANTNVTTESSPVGEVIAFMGTIAPNHYLSCDGSVYPIEDYPILAQFFATQFGTVNHFGGDGTTTFAVPDLRGEFLRGSGINTHPYGGSGAQAGTHQDPTIIPGLFADANNITVIGMTNNPDWQGQISSSDVYKWCPANTLNSTKIKFSARPTNTAVMYCIKYEPTAAMDDKRFLVMRPDLWPVNTEMDLGDNLYGIRVTGTLSASPNTAVHTTIRNQVGSLINCGGCVVVNQSMSGDGSYRYPVGHDWVDGNGNVDVLITHASIAKKVELWVRSTATLTNAPYDVWITYKKA